MLFDKYRASVPSDIRRAVRPIHTAKYPRALPHGKQIRPRTTRMLPLLLLAGLSWLAPRPTATADSGSRGAAMADAMAKMMDAMGFGGANRVDADSSGFDSAWEQPAPANGGAPWGVLTGTMPWAASRDMMERWSGRPWSQPVPTTAPRLNGVWLSDSGERLTIRGGRFRLEAGPGRVSEGMLQLRGALLALHQPRLNRTWIYEYAEHEGRLVLRDAQGQLFLYRRIP